METLKYTIIKSKKQYNQYCNILEELIISDEEKSKDEISNLVPPYVLKTQNQYMECPSCHRIFWRGTHWQAMSQELENFMAQKQKTVKGEANI